MERRRLELRAIPYWPIWGLLLSKIKGTVVHWWEHPLSTLYLPGTRSHPAMPTVLSIVLSLFGLFLLQLLLDLRRVAHDVGFVCP
jgi:hypothetical protein